MMQCHVSSLDVEWRMLASTALTRFSLDLSVLLEKEDYPEAVMKG